MRDLSRLDAHITSDFTGHGIEVGTKVKVLYKSKYEKGSYIVSFEGEKISVSEKELEPITV